MQIDEVDRDVIREIGEQAWEAALQRTVGLMNEPMPDFGWSSKDAIGKQVWQKHHSQAILEQCKVLEKIARMKKGELGRETFGGEELENQKRIEELLNEVIERKSKRES
ncbi:hypothetical protein N8000_07390 [Rhodospirillales bacterium]|nr:hypothetical protein [Rhodospirillales bacterium]